LREERLCHPMTEAVVSVDIGEPVLEAFRLLADHPLHHQPVVDGNPLKGMQGSADMRKLEFFLPKGGARASAIVANDRFKIATLLRAPVITTSPDDSIADAPSRTVTHGIHALPVVNANEGLLGIVTTSDIMRTLLHGMDPIREQLIYRHAQTRGAGNAALARGGRGGCAPRSRRG
jgi:CBS domain-containing membrane protein